MAFVSFCMHPIFGVGPVRYPSLITVALGEDREYGGPGVRGGWGSSDKKWAGAKNLNFGQGYHRKKIKEKKGVGVGRKKWVGVGGLNPKGRGSRPPCPPPHCLAVIAGNIVCNPHRCLTMFC